MRAQEVLLTSGRVAVRLYMARQRPSSAPCRGRHTVFAAESWDYAARLSGTLESVDVAANCQEDATIMSTKAPVLPWETIAPWSQNFPFRQDEQPRATVIGWRTIPFASWGPDPEGSHRTPCWIYVSTPRLGFVCTMSVAPGDFFEVGNHPNVETYYVLNGVLHLQNADSGQVLELGPDNAGIIPAFEYHVGYNFSTEEVYVLACIPGESHTAEMHKDPLLALHHTNKEIVLHGEAPENEGTPSKLRELAQWPPLDQPRTARAQDNRRVHRSDWLQFITGQNPRAAILSSFYYSTPQLAAGSVTIPPNRISAGISTHGETVIYVKEHCLVVNILETGQCLYAEKGDVIFVPPGLTMQYQNTTAHTIEAMTFVTPWTEATRFQD